MSYLGRVFKQLRDTKHISLAKASSGQFSPSIEYIQSAYFEKIFIFTLNVHK